MNEFKKHTGAAVLKKPASLIIIAILTIITGYLVADQGFIFGLILLLIPFVGYMLVHIAVEPRVGFILLIITAFFAIGLTRYIQGVPLGLTIDIILVFIIAMVFFAGWKNLDWKPAWNDLTIVSALWYTYVVLELINPESVSQQAWFYAMRGIGFYQLMIVIIAVMAFNKYRDLKTFLILWMVLSLLGTFKGIMQLNIGPDAWEQAWLDAGGDVTHLIFGNLRVFSFYSDAGQFGAAQGHAALVAGIIAAGPGSMRKKIIFWIIAFMSFYGLMISGTRGAIAVPGVGILVYLFLRKNFKVLIIGLFFFSFAFAFLKFTTIGQSNYQIARMRTVFDKEDASYLVRIENQQKIKNYMSTRPFGGGIGTAGNWGQRFSPGTFLANTPTDSWYVRIWAECGIIGLILHLAMLFYILIKCSLIIWFKLKDPEIIQIMIALVAGYAGILMASYGNGVLGQMPTGVLIYLSWVFIFISPRLEREKLKLAANKQ